MMVLYSLINLSLLFSPSDTLTNLVILAFLISSIIIGIWYLIGAILNNEKVKAGAKGELYQLIGTAIMIAIVIAALYTFATLYINVVNYTASFANACTSLSSSSPTNLYTVYQTLYAPVANGDDICSLLHSVASKEGSPHQSDITQLIDVPLASATVITSSLAEQSAEDFNMGFEFDGWLGFLSTLQPAYIICTGEAGTSVGGFGCLQDEASIAYESESTPYAGFDLIYKGFSILSTLLMTEVAFFITQLIFENIFLYIWPYMLFLGILFRTTIFTRKLGGLMIAIAIGAIAIYPALSITEFAVSSNLASSQLIGTTTTTQTIKFCNGGYMYTENFSQMPSIGSIATACDCYPTHGLFGEEVYAITGSLAGLGLIGNGASFINLGGVNLACTGHGTNIGGAFFSQAPGVSETALFNLITAYGFIGVIGYFIPIINILITINAIIGFSGVLGGDTQLAGISRLI